MYSLTKKAIAEFIGTFVLVFFACGTAIVTGANVVATSLAFGLCIVAMAYSVGNISGCHVNPAVSIGMLFAKKMSVKEFLVYIIAQFLGAIIGACVLYALLIGTGILNVDSATQIWATNAVKGEGFGGYISSILVEVVLTFTFVYAILGVTSKESNSKVAGIVIGLTLTLVHLIGINITGTSVNPARSFGPALMCALFGGGTEALAQYWVFLVAPLLGGIIAALLFNFLHKEDGNSLNK